LDWISCLRASQLAALAEDGGPLQPTLFDERDLAEITTPAYPGERLVVCRNPDLARERARKRGELLAATERDLARVARATRRLRRPLRGRAEIGLAVGAVLDAHKMAKHFELTIAETEFSFHRRPESIAREASLDGLYIVRTSLPAETMSAADTVRAYKDLARVERAFRSLKSIDLQIRPVHHWTEPRVRAHVFLCMLAYYIEWHLREAWAPLLFQDRDRTAAEAERASPVTAAERPPAHRRWAAAQLLRRPDRAPGHPDAEHRRRARRRTGRLHQPEQADTAAGGRVPAAQHRAAACPVSDQPQRVKTEVEARLRPSSHRKLRPKRLSR
jgi:Transposase DDE domain